MHVDVECWKTLPEASLKVVTSSALTKLLMSSLGLKSYQHSFATTLFLCFCELHIAHRLCLVQIRCRAEVTFHHHLLNYWHVRSCLWATRCDDTLDVSDQSWSRKKHARAALQWQGVRATEHIQFVHRHLHVACHQCQIPASLFEWHGSVQIASSWPFEFSGQWILQHICFMFCARVLQSGPEKMSTATVC